MLFAANQTFCIYWKAMTMRPDIGKFHDAVTVADRDIGELPARAMDQLAPDAENMTWNAHPAWFLDGNPVAG